MRSTIFFISLFLIFFVSCNKNDTLDDNNAPFIVVLGSNPIYSELGKPYNDPGANAYDITATGDTVDITSRLQTTDNVNINVAGKYLVRYNVSDEAGNRAEEKSRTVYVQVFK